VPKTDAHPKPSSFSGKAIAKRLKELHKSAKESPLFVVSASTQSGYQIPKSFQVEQFAGLQLLSVMENAERPGRITMFWTSEELFRAAKSRLETNLSIALGNAEELYVTQAQQRKLSRFWAKTLIGVTTLATVAAILSNLKNIEDVFINNLSKPNVELAVTDERSLNVILGRKTAVELTCQNLGSAPAKVRILPASPDNNDQTAFADNHERVLPTIPVGGSVPVLIRFTPHPGLNRIIVTGLESSGLYENVPLNPLTLPIRVWKAIDTPLKARLQYPRGKNATVVVEPHHGDPTSARIQYQATLTPRDDVEFVRSERLPLDMQPLSAGDVAVASWHDDELTSFAEPKYVLTLQTTTPKDEHDWKTITDRIEISVEAIKHSVVSP
jgi:hypothetical protein